MNCLLTNLIANPYTSHAVDRVCDSLIGDEHVLFYCQRIASASASKSANCIIDYISVIKFRC